MAICAWLAGEPGGCPDREQQVEQVCRGFLCPSLGSRVDYQNWMEQSGLQMEQSLDWTEQVMRTWEICQRRVARTPLARVARWIDDDTGRFVDRFGTILRAYRTGAMQYGCFVARKPTDGGR